MYNKLGYLCNFKGENNAISLFLATNFCMVANYYIIHKNSDKLKSFWKLISPTSINKNKKYHLEKTFQCHELPITKKNFYKKGDKLLCIYDSKTILWDIYIGNSIINIFHILM